MNTQLFIILLIAAAALTYAVIVIAAMVRMRGTRIVICPETDRPAAVTVDTGHAALSAVFEKEEVKLSACSRWPERADCNQRCSGQIAVAPEETRVFAILQRWYAGKDCSLCGRPIPPLHPVGPKPGLVNASSPAHETIAWEDIPPENLPAMFNTHLPVCSQCQVTETFRRRFPDLVIERKGEHEHGETIH